ncbi:MAG: hypothetical protein P4N60_13715 [Verrucomicrobiae bacterium]|nr:hypothetical protein [Verrucomicrobiae bacterium]
MLFNPTNGALITPTNLNLTSLTIGGTTRTNWPTGGGSTNGFTGTSNNFTGTFTGTFTGLGNIQHATNADTATSVPVINLTGFPANAELGSLLNTNQVIVSGSPSTGLNAIYSWDGVGSYTNSASSITNAGAAFGWSLWTLGLGQIVGRSDTGNLVGHYSQYQFYISGNCYVRYATTADVAASANSVSAANVAPGTLPAGVGVSSNSIVSVNAGQISGALPATLLTNRPAATATEVLSAMPNLVTNGQTGVSFSGGAYSGLLLPKTITKLFVSSSSYCSQLWGTNWLEPGGYSNQYCISYNTNTAFYGNNGNYNGTNVNWVVSAVNFLNLMTGGNIQPDCGLCVPSNPMWNIWGGVPAHYSAFTSGLASNGVLAYASGSGMAGIVTNGYYYVVGNEQCEWVPGSTNDLGIIINGTQVILNTNNQPVIFTTVGNVASVYAGPNGTTATNSLMVFGTPGAVMGANLYLAYTPRTAAGINQYMVPYAVASGYGYDTNQVGFWELKNAPTNTGIPAAWLVLLGDNDANGLQMRNDGTNSSFRAKLIYTNNISYMAWLKTLGYFVINGIEPLSYAQTNGGNPYLVSYVSLQRGTPAPSAICDANIDFTALMGPYNSSAYELPGGPHFVTFLANYIATNFINGLGWTNLYIPPTAPGLAPMIVSAGTANTTNQIPIGSINGLWLSPLNASMTGVNGGVASQAAYNNYMYYTPVETAAPYTNITLTVTIMTAPNNTNDARIYVWQYGVSGAATLLGGGDYYITNTTGNYIISKISRKIPVPDPSYLQPFFLNAVSGQTFYILDAKAIFSTQ